MILIISIVFLTCSVIGLGHIAFRQLKRTRFELEETKKNFALALKAGSISTWKYNIKDKIFTPLMGNVIAGQGFSWEDSLQVLHREDHQPLIEQFDALCCGRQESTEMTLRYFSPEHNAYRYYESKMSLRHNEEGVITHIIGTQRDITEKCIRKMELDNARKSMDLALNAADITAWDYDIQTHKYRTLYGNFISEKTASFEERFNGMHPDDVSKYKQFIEELLSNEQSNSGSVVLRMLKKESVDFRFFNCIISVIRNNMGEATHLIGSFLDISERLQLQHELEQANRRDELVINNVNSGLAYIGIDYIVQWENVSACSTSLSYEAYKKGEFCYQSAHGRSEPCEHCVMKRVFESKQVEQIEFSFDNGKSIEVFATPVFQADNELIIEGVVIRIDNITERKMMINALEEAKEKAEESDRLKSAFLANMSHEIRTPLNAIVGFADLLQSTDDPEEKEEYSKIIANNNMLLLQLISDILDLSKIESGMINLSPQEFDLASLFDSLRTTMQQRMREGVELIYDNPFASCIVTLDPNRLTQVATNFVTNAIKFTPTGHIKMGYQYVDGGIRFYVSDTGIGIAKEKQSKVFNRFEKLNDFAQGTGLGLSICKAIIEAHNGKIGLESTLGEGTTFWAWAPCQAIITEKGEEPISASTPHTKPVTSISKLSKSQTDSQKKSILIAEDIDSNYLLVSSILHKTYKLVRVPNGAEAVEAMRYHCFDLVLMDMKMPIMNGIEATQEIRKFNTSTPVIALTAHAFDSDRKMALEAGCNEYVVKPINRMQLMEAIEKYV